MDIKEEEPKMEQEKAQGEKTPEINGKTLQSMILGPKFCALPLDIRRRFSQNYSTKVTSAYEAAWAIIYSSNIDFESNLVLDKLAETSCVSEGALPDGEGLDMGIFNHAHEATLFPELSKLKALLVRFLENSIRTPGAHICELRMDFDAFPGVDQDFFEKTIKNAEMCNFLSHVRRNNWYQIIPGKIGVEPLYETLLRAESFHKHPEDLIIWKDINTLLIDPGLRAYVSIFYAKFIQNQSLSRAKINDYLQQVENLPLRWILM